MTRELPPRRWLLVEFARTRRWLLVKSARKRRRLIVEYARAKVVWPDIKRSFEFKMLFLLFFVVLTVALAVLAFVR
jgi:hypothetical protein